MLGCCHSLRVAGRFQRAKSCATTGASLFLPGKGWRRRRNPDVANDECRHSSAKNGSETENYDKSMLELAPFLEAMKIISFAFPKVVIDLGLLALETRRLRACWRLFTRVLLTAWMASPALWLYFQILAFLVATARQISSQGVPPVLSEKRFVTIPAKSALVMQSPESSSVTRSEFGCFAIAGSGRELIIVAKFCLQR